MNTVERIKSICKERKIAISRLEKDCGFANGYISGLRKGTVPDDRLQKIAEYLNVDPTFLSTGSEREQLNFDVNALTKAIEKSLRKEIIRKYHEPESGYYTDPETARLAQEMYDDPEMRSLFHMKRNMEPEKFKAHIDMMKKMYALEHPEDDDYGA